MTTRGPQMSTVSTQANSDDASRDFEIQNWLWRHDRDMYECVIVTVMHRGGAM